MVPYLQSRPLLVFYLLALAISWLIWSPLWLPYVGVDAVPWLPYQHGWGGLGPMVAAGLTTWWLAPRPVGQRLWRSLWQTKPLRWTALAITLPAGWAGLGAVIVRVAEGYWPDLSTLGRSAEFPELGVMGFLIYNMVFFGYGEEVGWRGFLLPRLLERHPPLRATLILSGFWAIWHLPLFAYRPGYMAMDLGGVAGWYFSLLAGAFLFTWLYQGTQGSLLACALFHGLTDVVFLADYGTGSMMLYIGVLVTLSGIAVLIWYSWHRAGPVSRS
ncbi:MAG: CPBP family intramembrane glutamic endopeptidase [Bacteroidia bacterium]|nr:CPBP family intramembrane glutamic endopeptidase [Bacteroidia bacterium]